MVPIGHVVIYFHGLPCIRPITRALGCLLKRITINKLLEYIVAIKWTQFINNFFGHSGTTKVTVTNNDTNKSLYLINRPAIFIQGSRLLCSPLKINVQEL